MKNAKMLVIVMTSLIAICTVLLVYGLVRKGDTADSFQAKTQETKTITLPAVSTIQLMSPYKNGIALYVATPKGDFIYFADPQKGLSPTHISIKRGD